MDVGVTGSIAFDHIMSFDGRFQDHILADKIHSLNVSFLVDGFEKRRGGCAANIAYACALHELRAGIIATVGHDFQDYAQWLESKNIDLSGVRVLDDMHTASCFITTDQRNNQITGFYPGAMAHAGALSLTDNGAERPRIVVIAPNAPEAMMRYPRECRELDLPYIYDPGQQVIALEAEALEDGLKGATALIANDYELATVQKKLGASIEDLLDFTEVIVQTLGEAGSRIVKRGRDPVDIPVAPVREVIDPTGCGDAFRGGFISGLLCDATPEICGRLGALSAAYCIEVKGTTEYSFSRQDFDQRYQEAFGEALMLGPSSC